MKTQNYISKQMTIILFIFFPLLAGMSSCKKDKTLEVDITKFEWVLQEINTWSETYKPEKKEYFRENAFVLNFDTDTTFSLNTSVNYAGGKYKMETKGKILIVAYGESSSVGVADTKEQELNQNLINVFKEVTEYKVVGKTLVFKGRKGEIEFKKK